MAALAFPEAALALVRLALAQGAWPVGAVVELRPATPIPGAIAMRVRVRHDLAERT